MKIKFISIIICVFLFYSCSINSSKEVALKEIAKSENRASNVNSAILHNYIIGEMALKNRNYELAKKSFEKVKNLNSSSVSKINENLVSLYMRTGNLEKALAEIELHNNDNNHNIKMLHAGLLVAFDRFEEAVVIYDNLFAGGIEEAKLFKAVHTFRVKGKAEAKKVFNINEKESNDDIIKYIYAKIYSDEEYKKSQKLYENSYLKNVKLKRSKYAFICNALENKDHKNIKRFCSNKVNQNDVICVEIVKLIKEGDKHKLQGVLEQIKRLDNVEISKENVYLNTAILMLEKQNFDGAIRELEIIVAKDADSSTARFYLASIYAGQGDSKLALEHLQEIKEGQPYYSKSRTFGSFLAKQENDFELAEELIRDALEVDPKDVKTKSFLLLILDKQKKYREVNKLLREDLEENPSDVSRKFSYAVSLHKYGNVKEALKQVEEIIEINPEHADALNFAAYSYSENETNLLKAIEYINRALSIRPNDGYFLDTLGWVHYKNKNYDEAKKSLREAIKLIKDDAVIYEHYADVLFKLNKNQEAKEYYKEALEVEKALEDADRELIDRVSEKLKKRF